MGISKLSRINSARKRKEGQVYFVSILIFGGSELLRETHNPGGQLVKEVTASKGAYRGLY